MCCVLPSGLLLTCAAPYYALEEGLTSHKCAAVPLGKVPAWLKRPVGASFGFGGKLVSFTNEKRKLADRIVNIAQISLRQVSNSIHRHHKPHDLLPAYWWLSSKGDQVHQCDDLSRHRRLADLNADHQINVAIMDKQWSRQQIGSCKHLLIDSVVRSGR